MNQYKVTSYVKGFGNVSIVVNTDLTIDQYTKKAKTPPMGMKKPLQKLVSVVRL